MIEFEHVFKDWESFYVNLGSYGSQIGEEGKVLTVFDGEHRKFRMKRHGHSQLSCCSRWFQKNDVKGNTKILVRYDSRESDEENNHVLHLVVKPDVPSQYLNSGCDTVLFVVRGKQYEIRRSFDGCTLRVRAFLDAKPANGFECAITFSEALDFKELTGSSAVGVLTEYAKNDILHRSWEKIQISLRMN